MKNISFSEAADFASITRDQLRYWIKLLHLKPVKKGRTLFLPKGSEKLLDAMKKAVKDGLSLKAAAEEVLNIHALPVITPEPEQHENNQILTARIASLEKAVMLLVEQNNSLATTNKEQNKLFAETFLRQEKRLDQIQFKLDPPQKKQIDVWKPAKPKPLQLSKLQRIWYQITDPIKLRAI